MVLSVLDLVTARILCLYCLGQYTERTFMQCKVNQGTIYILLKKIINIEYSQNNSFRLELKGKILKLKMENLKRT